MGALEKPKKGTAKRARARESRRRRDAVLVHMQTVRDRDRYCRFPMCGCRSFGGYSPPTVSHDRHRGAGGNPAGDRSLPDGMILLCFWRHQDGTIARDRKNLRIVALTEKKNRGPVAFEIKRSALVVPELLRVMADPETPTSDWIEVARERAPHELERLLPWQVAVLSVLAEMTL